MSGTATPSAETPDADHDETGTLTLDVSENAPLDSETVVLDMPWDSPEDLIVEAIECVDALGEKTREAALDIYCGEDGIGLGRWATADTREFQRGTDAPHDGLPGVGEARAETLAEARDDVLPEHPLVDWLRENPEVGVVQLRPKDATVPDYVQFKRTEPHGVRYVGNEDGSNFEAIIRDVFGHKDDREVDSSRASKWVYEYLHYESVTGQAASNDGYWFTGGEGEEDA